MSLLSNVRLPTIVSCIALVAAAAAIGLLVDFGDDDNSSVSAGGSEPSADEPVEEITTTTTLATTTTTTTVPSTTTTEKVPPPPTEKESSTTTTAAALEVPADGCSSRPRADLGERDGKLRGVAFRGDATTYPTNAMLVFLHALGSNAQEMVNGLEGLCDLPDPFRTILVLQGWETKNGRGLGWAADDGERGVTDAQQLTKLIKPEIEGADGVVFIGVDAGGAMALRASCHIDGHTILGSIIRAPVLHEQFIKSDGQYQLCNQKHPVHVQTVEPADPPQDDYLRGSPATELIRDRWGCDEGTDCLVQDLDADASFINAVREGLTRITPPSTETQTDSDDPTGEEEGTGD